MRKFFEVTFTPENESVTFFVKSLAQAQKLAGSLVMNASERGMEGDCEIRVTDGDGPVVLARR